MGLKIRRVTDAVVGESSLSYFSGPVERCPQRMRVTSLDELDGAFDSDFRCGSQQEVDVLGHDDECMQVESFLSAIAVERFKKQPRIRLDNENPSPLPSRKCEEICSPR
jgi:hypothetical protein